MGHSGISGSFFCVMAEKIIMGDWKVDNQGVVGKKMDGAKVS